MLHPTIEELTQGKYNRYELALAAARCARLITDEYVRQHEIAEKSQTGNKEADRALQSMIDRELRDEKAVKVAIGRINKGIYCIDPHAEEHPENAEELWEAGNEAEDRMDEEAAELRAKQNAIADEEEAAETDAEESEVEEDLADADDQADA